MSKKKYDNNSMSKLKGADRVRLKPAVIFGSDDEKGCAHTLFEILSNSVDEAKSGFGEVITIIRHSDMSWTIADQGRGIPLDWNEKEQCYNWEIALCELYGGGKYSIDEDQGYDIGTLGTNGLGLTSSQYASEFMKVTSLRDDCKYEINFAHGEVVGELQKEQLAIDGDNPTGTSITYKPDKLVFTSIDISFEWVKEVCQEQAVVAKGIKFLLINETTGEEVTYFYERGIHDYIVELSQEKEISNFMSISGKGVGKDVEDRPEYKASFDMVFCFNNEFPKQIFYHNSTNLIHGGSPLRAVQNAFVYVLDKHLKTNGKYNKGEKGIKAEDIFDSLLIVSSSFSTVTSYSNQTKTAINNKYVQELMTETIKEQLAIYLIENPLEAEKICQQVLINLRSRTKAESTRLNIKKKLQEKITITTKPKKFVDCRSKDKTKREIYIVEGDSALGSCKLGRNSDFQGIIAVRGKILNCLKAELDKIFSSEIIVDLFKVLGCGVEVKSKHNKDLNTFDMEQLQWCKICICTDADTDGWQIRCLILTALYRLAPSLIEAGIVFIADTPLYEITLGKGKKAITLFAYSDAEKEEILSSHPEAIKGAVKIQRSKGLGENSPEMMWTTTMNPETRRLIQVSMEDVEAIAETFDMFLGDDIESRRAYIAEHYHEYI